MTKTNRGNRGVMLDNEVRCDLNKKIAGVFACAENPLNKIPREGKKGRAKNLVPPSSRRIDDLTRWLLQGRIHNLKAATKTSDTRHQFQLVRATVSELVESGDLYWEIGRWRATADFCKRQREVTRSFRLSKQPSYVNNPPYRVRVA